MGDTYSVLTQRRKATQKNTPRKERKGEHPLDLIGVLEIVPNSHPSARAQSDEPLPYTETITVHAADFVKYGNDVEMLKTLKVGSPPMSEPMAVEGLQESA